MTESPATPTRTERVVHPLWLCADTQSAAPEELSRRVIRVLAGMPACVWLRPGPGIHSRTLLALAREFSLATRSCGGALVVGDRVDIAAQVGADGVHLSGDSIGARDVRKYLAAQPNAGSMWISAAVHDAGSVRTLGVEADVLVLSPFGSVPGKGAALGVGGFAAFVAQCPGRPIVALGGIVTERDAAEAARAGASAIAVRRALLEGPDPLETCSALHAAFVFSRARDAREWSIPPQRSMPVAAESRRVTLLPPA